MPDCGLIRTMGSMRFDESGIAFFHSVPVKVCRSWFSVQPGSSFGAIVAVTLAVLIVGYFLWVVRSANREVIS